MPEYPGKRRGGANSQTKANRQRRLQYSKGRGSRALAAGCWLLIAELLRISVDAVFILNFEIRNSNCSACDPFELTKNQTASGRRRQKACKNIACNFARSKAPLSSFRVRLPSKRARITESV